MSRSRALIWTGLVLGAAACRVADQAVITKDVAVPRMVPGGPSGTCVPAGSDLDYVGACVPGDALTGSFVPALRWAYTAPQQLRGFAVATPVAANLTDDNGDGAIDLCDVPDVVLATTSGQMLDPGVLQIISGSDGALLGSFAFISPGVTPAIGDMNGDGTPEIVAGDSSGRLVVLDASLTPITFSEPGIFSSVLKPHHGTTCSGVSLADLEGDGTVEMIVAQSVYEATGALRFRADASLTNLPTEFECFFPRTFDLDGDGTEEVLFGNLAYDASGQLLWHVSDRTSSPHVVDVDEDGAYEVLLTNGQGLELVTSTGTSLWGPVRPVDPFAIAWSNRAVAVDPSPGSTRVAFTTRNGIYGVAITSSGPEVLWSFLAAGSGEPVIGSGGSGTPALFPSADGLAPTVVVAMDEKAFGLDMQTGTVRFDVGGTTSADHVIVLDVDNDDSPDVVVTGSDGELDGSVPQLSVYGDATGRKLPLRRIWNEHAYRSGGVREDGRIARSRSGSELRAQAARACTPN